MQNGRKTKMNRPKAAELRDRNFMEKALVDVAGLHDKFHGWLVKAEAWQLSGIIFLTVVAGAFQDMFQLVLGGLDMVLGPIDEIVLGATPELILLELLRRVTGIDPIGWIQRHIMWRIPAGVLVGGVIALTLATWGLDASVYVPGIGLLTWPIEFVDSLIVGLPILLSALELRRRIPQVQPQAAAERKVEADDAVEVVVPEDYKSQALDPHRQAGD